MPRPRPLLDRFIEKIYVDWDTGCWIWIAGKTQDGYGHMSFGKRGNHTTRLAHAVAYELFVGPMPPTLSHDHMCNREGCANPFHIQPNPIKDNILRGFGPTAMNARKTHCIHGHALEGYNIIHRPNGNRGCRTCYSISARKYKNKIRHHKLEYGPANPDKVE